MKILKKSENRKRALLLLWATWLLLLAVDFGRLHSYEKPIFCVPRNIVEENGKRFYRGLGYSFDIKGSLLPEDSLSEVTSYTLYLFGLKVYGGGL